MVCDCGVKCKTTILTIMWAMGTGENEHVHWHSHAAAVRMLTWAAHNSAAASPVWNRTPSGQPR